MLGQKRWLTIGTKRCPVCLNGNGAHTRPNYQLHQMAIFTAFTTLNTYRLRGQMVGHVDAIHSLAVTSSGRLLASRGLLLSCMTIHTHQLIYIPGSDSVRLWDLSTLEQLSFPRPTHGMRGPVSCLTWIRWDLIWETLCYGTGLGYLVCCGQQEHEVRASGCAICKLTWNLGIFQRDVVQTSGHWLWGYLYDLEWHVWTCCYWYPW